MKKVKFTPGPWKVVVDERSGVPRVQVDEGSDAVGYVEIATIGQPFDDAHLIAAAPDLLAACERLVDYRNRNCLNWQLEKADTFIDEMRAAIAKAKGEQNWRGRMNRSADGGYLTTPGDRRESTVETDQRTK